MAVGNATKLTMLDAGYTGTLYLALFTAAPTDAGGGTEVSGGSYARQAITFAAASGTSPATKASNNAQTFPTPTADWGTVTHFGIMSASSGGTLKAWGALSASRAIGIGVVASASAGDFSLTLT